METSDAGCKAISNSLGKCIAPVVGRQFSPPHRLDSALAGVAPDGEWRRGAALGRDQIAAVSALGQAGGGGAAGYLGQAVGALPLGELRGALEARLIHRTAPCCREWRAPPSSRRMTAAAEAPGRWRSACRWRGICAGLAPTMCREPAPGCSSRLRERSDTSVCERGGAGSGEGVHPG